ncbi:hypothetical protein PISMIDRAFT_17536 [Pisolithus microcarpus 441]|uniref:Uncharacterized protein n=1 Tax=Pisolithus microcarpus 441 TaxID=765257 RepID=A0A0C9XNX0_9AGAM|nr:hypothetical protein PISMIDRAFT_17536 [Pisolithus microcarpus 441]
MLAVTPCEIDEVYACAAREDDKGCMHNAKAAQHLITWINRYLANVNRHTRKKPAKNPVAAYALSQWHPPTWMAVKGKSKRENYKPSITGLAPQPPLAYEEHQASPIEAHEEPIITHEPNPAPQVERIPPVIELPTPVAVTIQVMTLTVPVVLPVIDRQHHKKRWHQDQGPKVAPHWGAPLSQWREHIQKYLDVEETLHFLGVPGPLEELAEDKEAALVRQIRGFVLEGAIVESEGLTIIPGAKGTWDTPKDITPSPVDIAQYLARNRLSFQEADDLYSWGISFLQDESDALQEKGQQCHNGLMWGDYLQGTPEDCIADQRPLEYYLECAQELGLLDFWDVEPVPANVNSLSGVKVVGGMIAATDCDDDWDLDAPTASNVQQMDVDDSGLAPM